MIETGISKGFADLKKAIASISGGGTGQTKIQNSAAALIDPATSQAQASIEADLEELLTAFGTPSGGAASQTSLAALVSALGSPAGGFASQTSLAAIAAALAGVLATGGNTPSVVGTVNTQSTWTRPANLGPYLGLQVLSDSASSPHLIVFPGMGRINAGTGYIVKARVETNQKSCVMGLRLHLFNNSGVGAINDGTAYPALWANRASKIGAIDFPAMATEDPTTSDKAYTLWTPYLSPGTLPFWCTDGNLYGILEVITPGVAPASGQSFFIELTPEQN